DGRTTAVPVNRLQRRRRVRQCQLRVFGEKICDSIESTVIDIRGITVYEVGESGPVEPADRHVDRESRWAQADSSSLACSRSTVGGMASTSRSAPWANNRSARSGATFVTEWPSG